MHSLCPVRSHLQPYYQHDVNWRSSQQAAPPTKEELEMHEKRKEEEKTMMAATGRRTVQLVAETKAERELESQEKEQ